MSDHRHVRTKIIATIGPASATPERLTAMLDAGLDVCRLNFSHGDHGSHGRTLALIRKLAAERDQPICVLGDLCGPKIRLGKFETEPVEIKPGDTLRFVSGDVPNMGERLTVSYPGFVDEVGPGQRILIDDGLVRLVARERRGGELIAECVVGGALRSHKGVNLPDTPLSTPALTEKDRRDLAWALEHDIDYVALSFVRRPEDLYELKRLIKQTGRQAPVVIKVEKPEALEHLDELIEQTDAVLVARGDLGVEMDIWRVPLVQKDLVERCRRAGVPVIVATQMLQSMVDNPIPTRAEVSDVANAILDCADAVMLSGETAVGKYPVESVDMMNRIAGVTGEFLAGQPCREPPVAAELPLGRPSGWTTAAIASAAAFGPTSAIAHAAMQAALDLRARLVAVWTATGATARRVARYRLPMPVVALTYDARVQRQLALLYGVTPLLVEPLEVPREMKAVLNRVLTERGLAAPGDLIVVVSSTRPRTPGATDATLVHRIE